MGLDRDPALALEIHRVEDLCLHLTGLERAGELEETVSQGRLAVIDVGDDGEIPDESLIHSDQNDHTPRVLTVRRRRARLSIISSSREISRR